MLIAGYTQNSCLRLLYPRNETSTVEPNGNTKVELN